MTESEREKLLDRRIQRRLQQDHAYRFAATQDEQSDREREIEAQEIQKLSIEEGIRRLVAEEAQAAVSRGVWEEA